MPANRSGPEDEEVQDAPQRARDPGEHEQRHRRRSREPMDDADDHGPDGPVEAEPSKPPRGLVGAPEEIAPYESQSVADLMRTWLRVFSSPGESDRTADHRWAARLRATEGRPAKKYRARFSMKAPTSPDGT